MNHIISNVLNGAIVQTSSLELPFGTCGANVLPYYGGADTSEYTTAKCQRQLETDYIEKICGCKDAYMPGKD